MGVFEKIFSLEKMYGHDSKVYNSSLSLSYIILFSKNDKVRISAMKGLKSGFHNLPRTLWLQEEKIYIEATRDEKFSVFFYLGKAPGKYMGIKTNLENQIVDLRIS